MMRYALTIAYDGTAYGGWQIQPNVQTIQAVIEEVLGEITGDTVKVHGSGRTDQGVHAKGQVAHADLRWERDSVALQRALNSLLPADIRVMQVRRVAADFHARRSAVDKEYRYFVWNADLVPPTVRLYRTQVREPLDIGAMQEAAAHLVGRHDFAAFTANPNRVVDSTVRRLDRLDVRKRGRETCIVAAGEGFLYKMVRSLAGHLIRVGLGRLPAGQTPEILLSRQRTARVETAPPQGLFLWKVTYPSAILRRHA